jgi:endonuclease/exonuclease/phosphatase family metal-dependent hydrolase
MTATDTRRLRLLSANIQAGSSTRRYSDYVTRSWSHAISAGKRVSLDSIAKMAGEHDIVGLQEADPGSLRSGFTNQTHYLAEQGGFDYWSHQPNRNVARVASSANGLPVAARWSPMTPFNTATRASRSGLGSPSRLRVEGILCRTLSTPAPDQRAIPRMPP